MSDERITVTINAPLTRFHGRTGTRTQLLLLWPDPRDIWVTFADGTGALFYAHELVVQP